MGNSINDMMPRRGKRYLKDLFLVVNWILLLVIGLIGYQYNGMIKVQSGTSKRMNKVMGLIYKKKDILERHGIRVLDVPRSFEGIKEYLEKNYIEGIVFWKDDQPMYKIKRRDFGLKWE